jgi:hypothetical protein
MSDINEEWKASSHYEPSEGFRWDEVDDRKRLFVLDLLRHPGDLDQSLADTAKDQFQNFGSMLIIRFLAIICQSRNPRLACKVISWASGLTNETLQEIATSERVTKQAVQQMADEYITDLGLPKTPAMRTDDARENMSDSYNSRKND